MENDFIFVNYDSGEYLAHFRHRDSDEAELTKELKSELDRLSVGYETDIDNASELERSGDYNGAIEFCKTAIESDPDSFPFLYSLGLLYSKTGRPKRAIDLLGKAVGYTQNKILKYDIDSNIFLAFKKIGDMEFENGDMESGFGWYNKAVNKYKELINVRGVLLQNSFINVINFANLMTKRGVMCARQIGNKKMVEQGIKDLESAKTHYLHARNLRSEVEEVKDLIDLDYLDENIESVEEKICGANEIISALNRIDQLGT